MNALRRVWLDLQAGENVDLYLTLIAAVALALLNLTGIAPDSLIAPLILAVLALVSISILGNRYKLENILKHLAPTLEHPFLEKFPQDFMSDLERAREVWITGIHQSATLKYYYSLFAEKLTRGDTLRVLVLDPDGTAYRMAAMRFQGSVSAEHEQIRIRSTLDRLCELKKVAPDKLEIRTIDYLLEQSVFLLEPNSKKHATAYIMRYTFKVGPGKPKLIYRKGRSNWFDLTYSELNALWANAIPYECKQPND